MIEKMVARLRSVYEGSTNDRLGVMLFYQFVLVFLLTEKDGLGSLEARDRLASLHRETQESLAKLEGHSDLSRVFGAELDSFFRWAEVFQENQS